MRWISQLSSKAGRREADFYATPPSALAPLLDECPPPMGLVIEPAAGDGAIVKVLLERGYRVGAFELREQCMLDLAPLCPTAMGDWLLMSRDPELLPVVPWSIVTNPPFSIAREFAEACLATQAQYVALLLRINVEASNPWRKFWEAHPWTNRVVLWKRPSFTGHGTDACNYFWAVWRRA